jgi:hypothetical protein
VRYFVRREFKSGASGEEAVLLRHATDLHIERTWELGEALQKHQEAHRC